MLVPVAFGGNNTSGSIEVATAWNAHGGTGRHDFESETLLLVDILRGHPRSGSNSLGAIAFDYSGVRRLTPTECERLQGIPDGYTLIEYRGKPAADGPRYKALGNSMAVPCMRWIGQRIALVNALITHRVREVA
ncbi:DNA cytosine methyltransferase [Dyella sedimenti]|uniref:DNA cytosine methyltransferase n=1 Tax=Dyella sedimenti TaxID=2919947 RepID=UPI003CE5B461